MIKEILLVTVVASSLLGDIDYSMAVDSIKGKEAIATVSKGTDMTMDDVSNSVDSDKLTKAVMGSDEAKKATGKVDKATAKVEEVKKSEEVVEAKDTAEESGGLLKTLGSFF